MVEGKLHINYSPVSGDSCGAFSVLALSSNKSDLLLQGAAYTQPPYVSFTENT
jgi:hypothetical protein